MKIFFLVTILFVSSAASFSQSVTMHTGSFKIAGRVRDAVSKQAIEYATISLFKDSAKKIIDGSISDKKGFFQLVKIEQGYYSITVQCIGYTDFSTTLSLTGDVLLDTITLTKKSSILGNVTVTSTRRTVENKIDKLVYNVDKDVTSQGGVATDVLKKIPMVTVDADGNVELLGNPSVRFLINGKPSGIFGNSVADALQTIPNSQIQSIEVITSPSAKYDAAGTGGIINIILKKNKVQGLNGNINLSAGTRLENGSINVSWKKNNIGINIYGSGNAQLNAVTPNGTDRLSTVSTGNKRLLQQSESNFSRNSYKTGLGFDWAIDSTNSLTISLGYDHFANNNNGTNDQTFIQYNTAGNEISNSKSLRIFNNQLMIGSFDNGLLYKHNFKKENQSLEIGFDGSFSNNHIFYNQTQQYKTSSTAFSGASSFNPGKENESVISVDYTHPLTNKILIETGFKTGFESIISNANVLTLNTATGNFINDTAQSYTSAYHRTVYAGYLSATFSLLHFFDIKAGARYEYTVGHASYSNTGNVTVPDYHNLAPSFVVSHNFNKKQTLKFAFSYRIERPDYRDLNPFMNLSDPHNITTGNPNLQPEIGHNFELGYNKQFANDGNLTILLNYQRNSPDIKPYITYYPSYKIGDSIFTDVTVTTRANISAEERTGINISLSIPVSKKCTVRPNIMVFNRYLKNIYDTPPVMNSFGFRANINATYIFNKNWTAEAFGNYNLGMHWQGRQPSLFSYTLAARKQLFHSKGSFGLVIVNIFNKYIHQTSQQLSQNFVSNNYRNLPYRSFGISFTYKFGRLKFTKPKEGENYLYTPPAEN